jgi:hypothetical protein
MRNGALTFVLIVGVLAASSSRAAEEHVQLKDGVGRDLTMARCVICHSIDYITMVAPLMDRAGWEKSVRKMIDVFGAPVSEQEASTIVDYLGEHYAAAEAPRQ